MYIEQGDRDSSHIHKHQVIVKEENFNYVPQRNIRYALGRDKTYGKASYCYLCLSSCAPSYIIVYYIQCDIMVFIIR